MGAAQLGFVWLEEIPQIATLAPKLPRVRRRRSAVESLSIVWASPKDEPTYHEPMSLEAIGRELGMSHTGVRKIVERALLKLRMWHLAATASQDELDDMGLTEVGELRRDARRLFRGNNG